MTTLRLRQVWPALVRGAGVCAALGLASVGRAQSVPVVDSYLVSGTGTVRIFRTTDPSAFDRTIPGTFLASYRIEPGGALRLTRFGADLADVDLTFPGFLGLFGTTVPVRCAALSLTSDAGGSVDAAGNISVGAGLARVQGLNFRERAADGTCSTVSFVVDGINSGPMSGVHRPAVDEFRLAGSFAQDYESDSYTIRIDLAGHYANRPPTAVLGLFRPGDPQGGCPAVWRKGNPSGYVAEANGPGGLKGTLRSLSTDPDGMWPNADIMSEHWSYSDDGGPALTLLGSGPSYGPIGYGFGPYHRTRLLTVDRQGASSSTECAFQVVDTTPPVVSPPTSLGVACTRPDGTTPAESPELQAFLEGATASDVVDLSPTLVPPTVGAVAVSSSTLFRFDRVGGGPTRVAFAARDASGNEGSAESFVSVVDLAPPTAVLAMVPGSLSPTGSFVTVNAILAAWDTCGGVRAVLESIRSNDPYWDPVDIRNAVFGTDDRSFELAAYLAFDGSPRVFQVTYRLLDDAGNTNRVSQSVVVR